MQPPTEVHVRASSDTALYVAYGASILLTGAVQELAWAYPAFTQAILAVTYTHLALLFVMTRRFARPVFQWHKLAAVMALEVVIGFTGYFAGFREPLIMAAIALFEAFDRRNALHWASAAVLTVVLGGIALGVAALA